MKTNLIENRHIRVFISSTFRDMQDERDYLMKRTFPKLRKLAAERDVTLTELDLRWGITEEESKSGRVVEICLKEIENSIPFFIGIVGNRYGWTPQKEELDQNVFNRFREVENYVNKGISVTEMEMQFGVLARKEKMHAYFYIKEHDEGQDNPTMLFRLKEEIKKSDYPYFYYDSPFQLSRQVENSFITLLDELFPLGKISEFEKERIGQRAFLNQLCQNYIRVEQNFGKINKWLNDDSDLGKGLVIIGESGLGKSALIANWIKGILRDSEINYNLIYYFIGNGGGETTKESIIFSLKNQLYQICGWNEENEKENNLDKIFSKYSSVSKKKLIVVIDAINQILDEDNSKLLNWLPSPQKNIKILISTLKEDNTMEVLNRRNYELLEIHPLKKEDRKDLIKNYLNQYAKTLNHSQILRIIQTKIFENTLVLKTFLDELINFGIYELLDLRMSYYTSSESITDFFQVLIQSYEIEFGKNLVRDFLCLIYISHTGLTESQMMEITGSRPIEWSQFLSFFHSHLVIKNGLMFFSHSYIKDSIEKYYKMDNYLNKLRRRIIDFSEKNPDKRLKIEAAYQFYELNDLKGLFNHLFDPYTFLDIYSKEEFFLQKYWKRLLKTRYSIRDYENWDKQYNNLTRLYLYLSKFCYESLSLYEDAIFFAEKSLMQLDKTEPELYRQKALVHIASINTALGNYDSAISYLQEAREVTHDKEMNIAIINNLGNVYGDLHKYNEALECYESSLKMEEDSSASPGLATSYNNIGNLYRAIGNYSEAENYFLKALEISQRLSGSDSLDVASDLNSLGVLYSYKSEYNKSIDCLEKVKDIYFNYYGKVHEKSSLILNNLGYVYSEAGENKKGLDMIFEALQIRKKILPSIHHDISCCYNNIAIIYSRMDEYDNAIKYYKKALKIDKQIYGDKDLSLSYSYNGLGVIYNWKEEYPKAMRMYKKTMKILDIFLPKNHPHRSATLSDMVSVYYKLEKYNKALECALEVLSIYLNNYGDEDLKIKKCYIRLANLYWKLDNDEKVLEYRLKILEWDRKKMGVYSEETATAYHNLGTAYSYLGNYDEALKNYFMAIEIRTKILGLDHSDTLCTYSCIEKVKEMIKDMEKR